MELTAVKRYLSAVKKVSHSEVNVHDVERIGSALFGGGLAAFGLGRGSWAAGYWPPSAGDLFIAASQRPLHGLPAARNQYRRRPRGSDAIPAKHGVHVEHSVIIHREAEELYDAWRHFKGLPDFMTHLESVEELNERRSRWTTKGPLGTKVSWEAEIIKDRPGELIAWRTVEGSVIDTAGCVHFEPSGNGSSTQVTVNLKYNPPAGKAGAKIAKLLGADPDQQIVDDLQRFKKIMETEKARPSVCAGQH